MHVEPEVYNIFNPVKYIDLHVTITYISANTHYISPNKFLLPEVKLLKKWKCWISGRKLISEKTTLVKMFYLHLHSLKIDYFKLFHFLLPERLAIMICKTIIVSFFHNSLEIWSNIKCFDSGFVMNILQYLDTYILLTGTYLIVSVLVPGRINY
jgi:hypothetical protein